MGIFIPSHSSADGEHLITLGTGRLLNNGEQSEAAIWSIEEGRRVWRRLTPESIYGAATNANDGL